MSALAQLRCQLRPWWWRRLCREDKAAQLVEFAVSLPLLVVFVVGIFDFSSAFTLKQKLTNVARDAARVAASDPINDLVAPGTPVSINDAFFIVDNYLKSNNIDDCGIDLGDVAVARPKWTFSAHGGKCVGTGLIITVNRGYYFPSTGSQLADTTCTSQSAAGLTAVVGTCVSVQYGYDWRFGRAASLLGRTPVLPANITATAVAINEN